MKLHYTEYGLPHSSSDTEYVATCRGCNWKHLEKVVDGNYIEARNRTAMMCYMHIIQIVSGG